MLKQAIRKKILLQRIEKNVSFKITDTLFKKFDFTKFRAVHVYMSTTKEVQTTDIVNTILTKYQNCKVLIPKIKKNNQIDSYIYNHTVKLKENKYGIKEPTNGELYNNKAKIDLIIVPCLVLDKNGNRVGYGGGYYDRFIVKHPEAITVGLTENELYKIKDVEKTDIPLKYEIICKNDGSTRLLTFQ